MEYRPAMAQIQIELPDWDPDIAGTKTEAVKAESEVEIKSVIGHALPEIHHLLGP
ncbi:hypothetical protein P9209_16165 [Prescottella defluvii]|nr:hypothetical protein P9209_16165 [Prescottella defluvii]